MVFYSWMLWLIFHSKPEVYTGRPADKTVPELIVNKEFLRLDGLWELATIQNCDLLETHTHGDFVVFFGSYSLAWKTGEMPVCLSVKLAPTANPKEMDLTYSDGLGTIKVAYALYELQSDKLRICFHPPGGGRPTKLAANREDGGVDMVLRRVK